MKTTISTSIETALVERIDEIAKREQRTRSAIVGRLLRDALADRIAVEHENVKPREGEHDEAI